LRLKSLQVCAGVAWNNSEPEEQPKSNNMKKGKTLTVLVLAIEIASIIILHAVKINQSEKTAGKEVNRNSQAEIENHPKASYSLASFK